jgi:cell shape-determining protein MreC
MIFWSLLLIVYILLSFFVDIGKLPGGYVRVVLDLVPFAFGMMLVYRTRIKQRVGFVESLETRIEELANRYENLKYNKISQRLQEFEARLTQLESKLKG